MRPSTQYTLWLTAMGFVVSGLFFGLGYEDRDGIAVLAIGLAAGISAWLAGSFILDRGPDPNKPSTSCRLAAALVGGTVFHPLFFIMIDAGLLVLFAFRRDPA